VLPQLDLFTGLAFEEICRQTLWSLGLSGELSTTPLNIGRWWNANDEIDLVVLGETDAVLVECKWGIKPVGSDILAMLERKTSLILHELENRRIRFALCSRSGFTSQLIQAVLARPDVMLFDLPAISRYLNSIAG
jgi:AAA+ ATPase superfamily predicted ATPase